MQMMRIGHRRWISLSASAACWTAIALVLPIAVLAACMLIPNALELVNRLLYRPIAPRAPLTAMLIIQVALIAMPTTTFVSWRQHRIEPRPFGATLTIALAAATIFVGIYAYVQAIAMVAEFGD